MRVNDELVLDAGECETVIGQDGGLERIIRPARTTLFEQVLPYGLATMMLVTPSGWTLTESSREVRVHGCGPPSPASRRISEGPGSL